MFVVEEVKVDGGGLVRVVFSPLNLQQESLVTGLVPVLKVKRGLWNLIYKQKTATVGWA